VLLRELYVPTTADTIAESNETIVSGTASATEQSDNNNAPTVAITPASATEGSPAVFEFSSPSAIAVDYTFTFLWNCWKC
jgi:hypothetical protein